MSDPVAAPSPVYAIGGITTDWLEHVLAGAGFPRARVTGFSTERVGTGQAAVCCRIAMDLIDADPACPRSIVAKFTGDDEASRTTGVLAHTYLREVNFYRHLQPLLSIRTPGCYLAEIEGEGPEFALLLEDLAPASQGDQILGCSAEVARAAMIELAKLHSSSWRNAAVFELDAATPRLVDPTANAMKIYRNGLPHFLARCGQELTAPEVALLERLARMDVYPSELPHIENLCLIHNDYRLDNFLIAEGGGSVTIDVVDWQTYSIGPPTRDAAYFLGGCLLPELRRELEKGLVAEYHDRLREGGVSDYGFADCWSDYRVSTYNGLVNPMAAMTFVKPTERGDLLFGLMVKRHVQQILELEADEFLD